MKSRNLRRLAALGTTVALAIALSACSSSSGSNSSGGSSTSGAAANLTVAKADVAKAMDLSAVKFPMPSEAFDPGNKRIAVIGVGQSYPLGQQWTNATLDAVKAMGWTETQVFDTALDINKAAAYITQATEQKYDAIILQSYDANALKGPIDAALQAGIAISCISCLSAGYQDKIHDVSPDWEMQGEYMGAYIATQSDGKAKVLAFPDAAFKAVVVRFDSLEKYLEENCSSCTYEASSFSTSDLAKPGPPPLTAMLAKNPPGSGLTDVMTPYALAGEQFAQGQAQTGRTDLRINTFDTGTNLISMAQSGKYAIGGQVVSPNEFMGWAAVDVVARQLAGRPTWDAANLPSPLVTADNASEFPDATFSPTNLDFKSEFKKLWNAR